MTFFEVALFAGLALLIAAGSQQLKRIADSLERLNEREDERLEAEREDPPDANERMGQQIIELERRTRSSDPPQAP